MRHQEDGHKTRKIKIPLQEKLRNCNPAKSNYISAERLNNFLVLKVDIEETTQAIIKEEQNSEERDYLLMRKKEC